MTKKSKGGMFRRVGRAFDKLAGSSSSPRTNPPSPRRSPPLVVLSPSEAALEPLLPSPSLPALPVITPESPTPSTSALPQPATLLPIPSLNIPSVLQSSEPASCGNIVWTGLNSTLRALHSGSATFPPLQSAIGELISCTDPFEQSMQNRKEYQTLALELKTMSETLDRHLQGSSTFPMLDFVVKTIQSIQEQVNTIAKIEGYDAPGRALGSRQMQEAFMACERHIQVLVRQLQVESTLRSVSNEENTQLEGMKPAKLATYDSSLATDINRRACAENTRLGVLSDAENWVSDPNAPKVYWMNGMAGTGKTTIAYTFAKSLEERRRLGASFFCTRISDECTDANRIVPTIAYQLARNSRKFRSALCRVLVNNPDAPSRTISTQFERLIKRPLMEVKDPVLEGLVVVIDALDECTNHKGVELVLDTLLRAALNLPLKFFLASRPDPSIWNRLIELPGTSRTVYELHSVTQPDVQADIELYLQEELPFITLPQVKQLAELSGVLFIYAATAARYIRAGKGTGDLQECLDMIFSVNPASDNRHAEIDQLYTAILLAADRMFPRKELKDRMRLVLWTAICAREPVDVETLGALAGLDNFEKALAMLQPLRSVLHIAGDSNAVSILHASFPEFLFEQARSESFFCDPGQHNKKIVGQCLELMQAQLRFNICGLESSHVLDKAVPNLANHVDQKISPTLAYTCRYWADHLREAATSDKLHSLLQDFLSERLLFWMEVMNLKCWMGAGVRAMITTKIWLFNNRSLPEPLRLAEDAYSFVASFAANAISQSTPHIYVSALTLCHRSSTVYKNYRKHMRGIIEPKGAGIDRREVTVLASWTVHSKVNSVGYSPDGARLVIGCEDGSVILRDAYDGSLIGLPLIGHTSRVRSVSFSPDGARIVTGSDDCTICIWSNLNGSPTMALLKRHTGPITSVAFSPDGTRVVSGSRDYTVCVWNVHDSTLVRPPLEGHTAAVTSVAFSPDGTSIASGSEDITIRLWGVKDGMLVGTPLRGHANYVLSVAFSPDGKVITSGSLDGSIRIWNVHDGTPVGAPLRGHNNWVCSVAFSPDGTRIISGSCDSTVRVWNVHNGTPSGITFEGHAGLVWSVAVSPDGTRVISGSSDCTVRVWSMQHIHLSDAPRPDYTDVFTSIAISPDGAVIACGFQSGLIRLINIHGSAFANAPLLGHTQRVNSIAFSSHGSYIVSGSEDYTIRIWSAKNGSLIGTPLEGHVGAVRSVAFSPDGTYVASGSNDCTIRIWSARDGTPIGEPFWGHTDFVLSVAFSPHGTQIVSGSADRTVCLWDAKDGALVAAPLEGHTDIVWSVAYSPDGSTVASGSYDSTIRVWDVKNGTLVGDPLIGHRGHVNSITFSSDGQRIISGSLDQTVRIWNVEDGTLVNAPLQAHTGTVWSVGLPPDNAYIASMCKKAIRVWDLHNTVSRADTCVITKDGWVMGQGLELLYWLPQDLVPVFPTPSNRSISANGPISFDYNNLPSGDDWKKCYSTPE